MGLCVVICKCEGQKKFSLSGSVAQDHVKKVVEKTEEGILGV